MATETIEPVGDLIKRLRAGKTAERGFVVVWVENLQAFIDTEMFRTFPEWRKIFREEFDALKAAAEEAADRIEAQDAALAQARAEGKAERMRAADLFPITGAIIDIGAEAFEAIEDLDGVASHEVVTIILRAIRSAIALPSPPADGETTARGADKLPAPPAEWWP